MDPDDAKGGADHTLADIWRTIAPDAETIVRDPRVTIKPERRTDNAGRGVIEALALRLRSDEPRFRLAETLGEGGMGRVHLATQAGIERDVAVKTLKSTHRNDRATLKLLQEGWITGGLEHPNVVPVYDLGLEPDGTPYLVLRRIEGRHWGELICDADAVKERFGADDLLEWNLQILVQVCNAVHFAHSRGILHRDLKPENVMIGAFGEVYVLDWGIAVALRDDGTGRLPLAAAERRMAGTPCYMAPEMLTGGAGLVEGTDVYLLGAVLFEVLAGRPPHEGADLETILEAIRASTPALPDDAPHELAQICRQAMARDAADRFPSAEALRLAVLGFLRHRGSALLTDGARRQLEGLRDQLQGATADDRLELYDKLGACRFGFREALRSWPDNDAASRGLEQGIALMVRYELDQGEPRAASLLLAELHEPSPELAHEVAEAERHEARHRATLARIARENDPRIGQRTRLAIAAFVGAVWTVAPLVAMYARGGEVFGHQAAITWSAVFFAVMLVIAVWGRESMTATAINRRVLATIALVPALQIVLDLGAWSAGMSPRLAQVQHLLLWGVMAAMLTLTLERRIRVAAAGYFVGYLCASARPDLLYPIMSASNLVLVLNAMIMWRWDPNSIAPSDLPPGTARGGHAHASRGSGVATDRESDMRS